jgi:Tol biopolymer transport system component
MNLINRMTWWTSWSAWRGAAILVPVLVAASCKSDTTEPPTVGSIQVDVATTGSDLDADGYTVLVDGGSGEAVGVSGSVTFSDLSQGNHEVTLDGLAANCSVTGSNPRTVSVTAGEVSQITMDVVCALILGDLVVTTTTSGSDQDDAYQYSVDGGAAQNIGANATETLQLAPGSHEVVLSDVAANCTVTGGSTQTVSVTEGGSVNADFEVTCAAIEILGDLVVTTTTSGSDQDDAYQYSVDGGAAQNIGANTAETLQLAPGSHEVVLSDVAANCTVTGGSTQTVSVTEGGSVNADFEVTCVTQLSNQIVFDSDQQDPGVNWDIYVMDPNGSNVQRLTTRAAEDREPYVSMDGTRIAFVSDERGNEDIWVMNADGSGLTNLTPTSDEADNNPAWSPDGTKIVFSRRPAGGARNIWVMDADGGNLTQLTSLGGTSTASLPAWSPDGQKIVYHSDSDGDADIYVMTTDGSSPGAIQQLTFDPAEDFGPAFSPDGSEIAFTTERDGNREIYVMSASGADPTNITNDASDDLAPQWSPDGSQIAFASDRDGDNDIYVINSDGSGSAVNITNNTANDFEVSWSP